MAGSATAGNLAVVAVPSGSYVSGDTTLSALHDGYDPANSLDSGRGSYGNWNRTGTQWVQYDWPQPICTDKIDVYWWDDHRGVRLPKASRLLYWDGQAFVPVANASGLGVAGDRYNTTTFGEVRTHRLRLEMDSNDTSSTGVLEWKVYDSGRSPEFPPSVEAGCDRVVVLGARTYLSGAVRSVQDDRGPMQVRWTCESGPGGAVFADADKAQATAVFSAAGDHVLRLTAGTGPLSGSDTLAVKVVAQAPQTHLDPVDPSQYKVDSPLWSARIKALIVNWIPHCIAQINDPNLESGGICNFVEAGNKLAGRPHKAQKGAVFANTAPLNTVESICMALRVDPQGDPEVLKAQQAMRATLGDWIPKILAAQEPDGYLQTAYTLGGMERWSPGGRWGHEGYIAGYFIEAAIAHYETTRRADDRLYKAARRLADCWVANLGPGKKDWYDGHQEMELALVRLGRLVNEVEGGGLGGKYIALARFLLDCRRDGSEYDQSHLPVTRQYEAVGHAVRAVYSYAGMADVALETRDLDYQGAVMSLWHNIVHRKYYVTGGVGSGETSEGFGPDYSLPNNAYCESCSSCGQIFLQHRLNLTYHDARYADLLEETLYNALLGSIDLEGKNFYYTNPLDGGGARYPWHVCPCCVGNIPRVLLALPTWTYARDADGLYVNLFIGGSATVQGVAGTDVQVVQSTDYPWKGEVGITVNPKQAKTFSVYVRVPNRKTSELYSSTPEVSGLQSLSVNGSPIPPKIEKGYAVIKREWKAGDRIDLILPLEVQRVKAGDRIAANRGRVALRYGPLIYSIEAVDQDISQVLGPGSVLRAEWRQDLLGGVTVVRGVFAAGSPMTAIPYYARNNRSPRPGASVGSAGSRVWVKDQ